MQYRKSRHSIVLSLTGVCPYMSLQVMTSGESFTTAIMITPTNTWHVSIKPCICALCTLAARRGESSPEGFFSRVRADVFPQVAERGEVFGASLWFTVERLAGVEPLVCFQSAGHNNTWWARSWASFRASVITWRCSPVQSVEGFLTALNVTLEGFLLGVNAHVYLQAVGREKGFAAALLVTHEGVLAAVRLLMRAQVSCCAVGASAALKHALITLHLTHKHTKKQTSMSSPHTYTEQE